MRILVIEDDKEVAETIKTILGDYYAVETVSAGRAGEFKGQTNEYDLIIVDVLLPDMDGISICRELRNNNIHVPILFITGKGTLSNKLQAFNVGADGFIIKPFRRLELLARVRALIKRNPSGYLTENMNIEGLMLDSLKRTVFRDKQRIELRKKEFQLLEYLMRNKNNVLTRSMILEHVWEDGIEEVSNTVDVHIKHLRDKVDKPFNRKLIKTVHGIGYKIEE